MVKREWASGAAAARMRARVVAGRVEVARKESRRWVKVAWVKACCERRPAMACSKKVDGDGLPAGYAGAER